MIMQKKRLQKRKYLSWLAICLLVLGVCVPSTSLGDETIYEGPGWDTPEDAVLHFLEGLKEQDLDKMISAYSVETYIDHFDMAASLKKLGVYSSTMIPRLPNTTSLLRSVNIEARKNGIVQALSWQISNICMSEEESKKLTDSLSFSRENQDEEITAFVEELENVFTALDFSTLNVLRFTPPERMSETYASEANQQLMKTFAADYGADDLRSISAVFTVGDRLATFTCDAIRYGDKWFIHRYHGTAAVLANIPAATYGMVSLSIKEIESYINADPEAWLIDFATDMVENQ